MELVALLLGEYFMAYFIIFMIASVYLGFKVGSFVRKSEQRVDDLEKDLELRMDDMEREFYTRIDKEYDLLRQEINQKNTNSNPTSKS